MVIGNPPYMRVQGLQQTQAEYMDYYREKFNRLKATSICTRCLLSAAINC